MPGAERPSSRAGRRASPSSARAGAGARRPRVSARAGDCPIASPWISHSATDTEGAGRAFAPFLRAGDVVALSGALGAGKTRLVEGLARGLGFTGQVRSPTFTLVHEYRGREMLFHVDLYRLDGADRSLGLEEHLERGILAVEWGEKLPDSLLADALSLTLEIGPGSERRISARVEPASERGNELLDAWRRVVAAPGTA